MSGSVTKGMSENAISRVKKTADKVVHPVAVIASGQTAAHHQSDAGSPPEREGYQPEGGTSKGFTSSTVPTLEEKTIFERQPDAQAANSKRLFDLQEEHEQQGGQDICGTEIGGGEEPSEAEFPREAKEHATIFNGDSTAQNSGVTRLQFGPSDKELFGISANASASNDDMPMRVNDRESEDERKGMEEGHAALKARKILRKHLSAKIQVSPWSMPTPTPDINPNGFHDPLDEKFWRNMWVATAVHNVSDSNIRRRP